MDSSMSPFFLEKRKKFDEGFHSLFSLKTNLIVLNSLIPFFSCPTDKQEQLNLDKYKQELAEELKKTPNPEITKAQSVLLDRIIYLAQNDQDIEFALDSFKKLVSSSYAVKKSAHLNL
jgi:hypothetical protein